MDTLPKAKRIYLRKQNKITDYQLMKQLHEKEAYDISFMCRELSISRAAYYKWLKRKPAVREIENEKLLNMIKEAASSNNSLFGSLTMTYYLRNRYGLCVNHKRVCRLMCIHDTVSNYRRKPSYHFKRSAPEITAENLLNRDFNADHINEKWCTDVTEIRIGNDRLYISPVIDLCDRYPVALCVAERNDTLLTDTVMNKAHEAYPCARPLYHSDRGFQYTRAQFKTLLCDYGMTQSMSRVSRCIDNGPCEQYQGQLKEIIAVLYPDVRSKEEMIEAIYKANDYYINFYPQRRFKGKTAGMIRQEALANNDRADYPIRDNPKIIKYWNHIEELKTRSNTAQ